MNASWFETPEAQERERQRKAEEEMARANAAASLRDDMAAKAKSVGIYERTVDTIFSGTLDTDATEAVANVVGTLVLSGGPGCGKTVAAALWLTEEIRAEKCWKYTENIERELGRSGNQFIGRRCVWITAAKLARADRYDDDKMTVLLRCPRLVIDDLGGEYLDKGGFYASMLDELINERHAAMLPTVLTTNLNDVAFKARYGERIADRIRESGRFVGCGDVSMRRKSA